jgi:hypothetical protein
VDDVDDGVDEDIVNNNAQKILESSTARGNYAWANSARRGSPYSDSAFGFFTFKVIDVRV